MRRSAVIPKTKTATIVVWMSAEKGLNRRNAECRLVTAHPKAGRNLFDLELPWLYIEVVGERSTTWQRLHTTAVSAAAPTG